MVLIISHNSQQKDFVPVLKKLESWRPVTLQKKEISVHVFLFDFCKIFSLSLVLFWLNPYIYVTGLKIAKLKQTGNTIKPRNLEIV